LAKRNGGYIIAVHFGVNSNDTGCDGLPAVYLDSIESAQRASCLQPGRRSRRLEARVPFLFWRFLLSCLAFRTDEAFYFVIPALSMVVVHLAGRYNDPDVSWMFERLLLNYIVPAATARP